MLISQKIGNLLNGVSQQPKPTRHSSQAQIQENALSSWSQGLRKRPPTHHIAQLDASSTGYSTALIHAVNRTSIERYIVAVVNGAVKVFDAITGASQTVVTPQGTAYLGGSGPYKATTVGDTTFIVDTSKVVAQGTNKAPDQPFEALLFMRSVDYSTVYSVTLNSSTVSIATIDPAAASARAKLSTDSVCAALLSALLLNVQISADFAFTQLGSTIYLKRKDGADFTLTTTDGLSDKGLRAVKGGVQTVQDLPEKGVSGMVLRITGDAGSPTDDFWVRYDNTATPSGVGIWRECPAPGAPLDLDGSTMPWALTRNGSVLQNLGHQGQPPAPTIADPINVGNFSGFSLDPDTSAVLDPTADYYMTTHGQRAQASPASLGGLNYTGYIFFDVDTTLLIAGTTVTVTVTTSAAGTVPTVKTYAAGQRFNSQQIIISPRAYANGSTVTIKLTYSTNVTPTFARRAVLNLHGSTSFSNAGVTLLGGLSRAMTFADTYQYNFILDAPAATLPLVYPKGSVVTVVLDGTVTLTFTATADKTATQMATGIAAVIDAHASYAATSSGTVVTVTTQTGVAPAPTFTASIAVSKLTTFWNNKMGATAAAWVGYVATNTSDGSHGTITENGTDYLIVASLTGGATNNFNVGDEVTVSVPSGQFVFARFNWDLRGAGDMTTCPMPSFVGKTISEIFFFENRLGFTSDVNIVLSEAGNLANFFRITATDLLASDLIDIKASSSSVLLFQNAVVFGGKLWLFSTSGQQYTLSGNPVLSPASVSLDSFGSYPSANVRPLPLGKRVMFARTINGYTRIHEGVETAFGGDSYQALGYQLLAPDITIDVPQYLPGNPLYIAGDAGAEFVAVLCDGATDSLFVYGYHYEGDQKQQSSWSKWTFTGASIIAVDMLNGVLNMLVVRSGVVYLETLDVVNLPAATSSHQDRQSTTPLVSYTFKYRPTTIYKRDQNGLAQTMGRLQVRFIDLFYSDTCDFTVTVTPEGRTAIPYVFTSATAAEGQMHIPIQSRNTAVIEITNATAAGCAFSGIDVEAQYDIRSRPV